jgi:hypothetical protein
MNMTAITSAGGAMPVLGQAATTTAAMRAAAALIDSTGITGLSVTCDDSQITIQVGEHLGDAASRAALVTRLAAAIGTTAVRADSRAGPDAWIRADGAISGLRVWVFTPVGIQHAGALPLACDPAGSTARAATPALPPGWRWLTTLDPVPPPAPGQEAR